MLLQRSSNGGCPDRGADDAAVFGDRPHSTDKHRNKTWVSETSP
ncbi:hypothetical protein CyaNS01_00270 [Cyanobium sp. NS01]|nr:hypothetical protein CyaNS01_00270 [Cyanobium sp. NS01]